MTKYVQVKYRLIENGKVIQEPQHDVFPIQEGEDFYSIAQKELTKIHGEAGYTLDEVLFDVIEIQTPEQLFPPNEAFWQKFAAELARERWEQRCKEVWDGVKKTNNLIAEWQERAEKAPEYITLTISPYQRTNDPKMEVTSADRETRRQHNIEFDLRWMLPQDGSNEPYILGNAEQDFNIHLHGQGAAMILTDNGTIPTGEELVRVNPAGPVKGIILEPGTRQEQCIHVINEGDSFTFSKLPGVSNVANKEGIERSSACQFVWDTQSQQWWANWPREQQ